MKESKLILHCGAERVGRDDLKQVETPEPTASWKPVPHYDMASVIANQAQARGYQIDSEAYGLTPDGNRLFGLLKFHPNGNPEYSRCLGFRNSHDKTFAAGLSVGVTVFVCDNLCFGGEETIHRRHTKKIDLETLVPAAFDRLEEKYIRLEHDIDRLKLEIITVDQARVITCIAAEIGAIRPSDILTVVKEFKAPRHEEFSRQSKWCLYNGFTETAKKYSMTKADTCYRGLAKLFGLARVP